MKLAVVGSRRFTDLRRVMQILREDYPHVTLIVSGGAIGADKCAEKAAAILEIPTKIFYPQWNKYGRGAGFVRNKLIEKFSEEGLAFTPKARNSAGTENTISLFMKADKPCRIEVF